MNPLVTRSALALALAVGLVGCSSTKDQATDRAVMLVKQNRDGLKRYVVGQAKSLPQRASAEQSWAVLSYSLADSDSDRELMLARHSAPDRTVIDFALQRLGEAGGGWSYVSVEARMCLTITVTYGPAARAMIRNLTCPRERLKAEWDSADVMVKATQ